MIVRTSGWAATMRLTSALLSASRRAIPATLPCDSCRKFVAEQNVQPIGQSFSVMRRTERISARCASRAAFVGRHPLDKPLRASPSTPHRAFFRRSGGSSRQAARRGRAHAAAFESMPRGSVRPFRRYPPSDARAQSLGDSINGRSPSPNTTRSNGPSSNMRSGRKVACIPPATITACGARRRARCASSRSNCSVIPVVEMPMTSHASKELALQGSLRRADTQFGSNTRTRAPAFCIAPARRHTPSGGARNVYSPQCGS